MSKIEFLSPPSSVSMADEWFEFANADNFWMQWRHRVLLQQLSRLDWPIKNALDVGCGHGIVREMMERDLGIRVDGCDLNQRALEMAANGQGRLFVYNVLERNPAILKTYDLVLLMDVIEHLDDDVGFLKASIEHLRPGGLVVINVPAYKSAYSKYDTVAGHKRRYNRSEIKSLFAKANVETLRINFWGLSLVPVLFARKALLHFVSREHTIQIGFAARNIVSRSIFRLLQWTETSLPLPMPVGSSLMAVGRTSRLRPA